jgi:S-DNA-T family DNA segregation ATPase FtsK/SpoIIIE
VATGKSKPKRKTAKRSGPSRKGGSSRRKAQPPLLESLRATVSREAVGIASLVLGLFFTAAFFSGRGAFLGEAGLYVARNLFGDVGLALAPLAVVGGMLLILDRLPARAVVGGALLLLGLSTTLATAMPRRLLFASDAYPDAGGLLGSGAYSVLDLVGGAIGTVLALALLYSLGLSLLTGVGFGAAFVAVRDGLASLTGHARGRWEKLRGRRGHGGDDQRPREPEVPDLQEEAREEPPPEPTVHPPEDEGPTREFEVILPESSAGVALEESRPVEPGEYTPPPFSILDLGSGVPEHDAEGTSERLTRALADLGVEARVVRAVVGPRVTRYELRLGSGVKVGKVSNLQHDIAYALAATEVRILAPIPGKSAVGVEVPNTRPAKVTLGDVFREYPDANDWTLPVGLGKDISGRAVFFDLAEMPHLLVAGTTGSGKSVMLNGLLTSLLLTTDPRQVKMVLIDPKRVELSPFGRVPHLITPVVTDVKRAANALQWAVAEMERRYEVLEKIGSRSLEGYNLRAEMPMPYVVLVIDELADLMMQAGAKVEDSIVRRGPWASTSSSPPSGRASMS